MPVTEKAAFLGANMKPESYYATVSLRESAPLPCLSHLRSSESGRLSEDLLWRIPSCRIWEHKEHWKASSHWWVNWCPESKIFPRSPKWESGRTRIKSQVSYSQFSSTYWAPVSFMQAIWIIYCVPGTVLGTGDTYVNEADLSSWKLPRMAASWLTINHLPELQTTFEVHPH